MPHLSQEDIEQLKFVTASSDPAPVSQESQTTLSNTTVPARTECETRIEESVAKKLRRSSYWEVQAISVSCKGEIVTLRGPLSSFFLKQLVQEIARSVPDVDQVLNECTVVPSDR